MRSSLFPFSLFLPFSFPPSFLLFSILSLFHLSLSFPLPLLSSSHPSYSSAVPPSLLLNDGLRLRTRIRLLFPHDTRWVSSKIVGFRLSFDTTEGRQGESRTTRDEDGALDGRDIKGCNPRSRLVWGRRVPTRLRSEVPGREGGCGGGPRLPTPHPLLCPGVVPSLFSRGHDTSFGSRGCPSVRGRRPVSAATAGRASTRRRPSRGRTRTRGPSRGGRR